VQLHDHAVVARHQSHLSQHLGAKQLGVASFARPRRMRSSRACASTFGRSAVRAVGWPWSLARGPVSAEEARRRGDRSEIAAPLAGVLAGQLAKPPQIDGKILAVRVDDVIGAEGRDHSPRPARRPDRGVMLERIKCRFGGRQNLDAEALEERARPECRLLESGTDGVEIIIGGFRLQPNLDAKYIGEDMVEPKP